MKAIREVTEMKINQKYIDQAVKEILSDEDMKSMNREAKRLMIKNFKKNCTNNIKMYDIKVNGVWYTPKMLEFLDIYEANSITVAHETILYRTAVHDVKGLVFKNSNKVYWSEDYGMTEAKFLDKCISRNNALNYLGEN